MKETTTKILKENQKKKNPGEIQKRTTKERDEWLEEFRVETHAKTSEEVTRCNPGKQNLRQILKRMLVRISDENAQGRTPG